MVRITVKSLCQSAVNLTMLMFSLICNFSSEFAFYLYNRKLICQVDSYNVSVIDDCRHTLHLGVLTTENMAEAILCSILLLLGIC